jgi:hypothetical protein
MRRWMWSTWEGKMRNVQRRTFKISFNIH